ncbi:Na+/H+ antiporter [Xanthobacter sp. TB0139]|uniref:Na+/H+ antiporter n=1 Tax=Xanthobacter sp. TB0139 TaxID=3459178 RepID=UPI0040394D8F
MEMITTVLVLFVAVVVSGWITRASPVAVPLPLVQIALGAMIAQMADVAVELQPDIFFLLFLPPLLFLDGWRIPKEGLLRDKTPILSLALGLVVFTVLGVGFFTHWMIPAMPLAVAFALAAILSPTDPIAVAAIAERVPVPRRLMNILDGEALLNDASGLVCMSFAVAAVLTGTFSLVNAVGAFVWLVVCGASVGVLTTLAVTYVKQWLTRRLGEESGSQVLISLLIPFGAYLAAEYLGGSGILAVVSAGITMSFVELGGKVLAATRMRRSAVWDMIEFAANGVIFVLLGEQLPRIIDGAAQVVREAGERDPMWLLFYVAAITGALVVLRLLWSWVTLRITMYRARRRGQPVERASWRLILVTAIAGVRGTVTLAGVLSLPLFMDDGSLFPARDLAIFLAAGVIILSLILASICLPFLLKGVRLPAESTVQKEEARARIAAAQSAIRAIEQAQHVLGGGRRNADLYTEIGARVMALYRQRIDGRNVTGDDAERFREAEQIEKELRLAGLRAEREEFYRRGRHMGLSDTAVRKLVEEVDLVEARITAE